MKLSDAFVKPVETPQLQLVCTVYNINSGRNRELLAKCPFLQQYMTFVEYVQMYHRETDYDDLGTAINRAISRCIEEDVLRDFLMERQAEVVKVIKMDYTFDRQLLLEREESRTEGRAEGRAEGRIEGHAEGRIEGRAEGRAEGRMLILIDQICRKILKGKTSDTIAEDLEEDPQKIRLIYQVAMKYAPDYDSESIMAELNLSEIEQGANDSSAPS